MPPERALLGRPGGGRHLRLVPKRPLKVVDCAFFYGTGSDEARAYVDAKVDFARRCGEIEHHLLVPTGDGRLPLGGRGLLEALDGLEPDVVLLHDPFFKAREVCRLVRARGGVTVMVQHGAPALDAPGRGRSAVYERALRAWLRHSYDDADAVMTTYAASARTGRAASVRLRFGVDPAFGPQPDVEQGDHVLYAGRVGPETGVFTLLEAMAQSRGDWTLRVVGDGPAVSRMWMKARDLGVAGRLEHAPSLDDRRELAREYASARCVVVPGAQETFGLAALQAAACGVPVVLASDAPAAPLIGVRAQTFAGGDAADLLRAIGRARLTAADPRRGAEIAARHTWDRAFGEELRALEALARW